MSARATHGRLLGLLVALAATCTLFAVAAASAGAETPSAWWRVSTHTSPTTLPPESGGVPGKGELVVQAVNVGDGAFKGGVTPLALTDVLPPGFKATKVEADSGGKVDVGFTLQCTVTPIRCTYAQTVPSFHLVQMRILVEIEQGAGTYENHAAVEVGEGFECVNVTAKNAVFKDSKCTERAPNDVFGHPTGEFERVPAGKLAAVATTAEGLKVSSEEVQFGVSKYQLIPEEIGGAADTRAGTHPFQLTSTFGLNRTLVVNPVTHSIEPITPQLVKNLEFTLPPGLAGNAATLPQCSMLDFTFAVEGGEDRCPDNTAMGTAIVSIYEPKFLGYQTITVPLFNLAPAVGEPARFGFFTFGVPVVLDTKVRTGRDYAPIVTVNNADEAAVVLASQVTFWGTPTDPRHDNARGWACTGQEDGDGEAAKLKACKPVSVEPKPTFMTLPTSCTEPLRTLVTGESWLGTPLKTESFFDDAAGNPYELPLTDCGALPFSPSLGVQPVQGAESEVGPHPPATTTANTPTGLAAEVTVPQQTLLEPEGLAQADVKDTTTVLPQGIMVSPSAAHGLQACSIEQVGFLKVNEEGTDEFTPSKPKCPDASKVGNVRIRTPLLAHELIGGVYLAEQNNNPFGSLLAMYVLAEDERSGVIVKLAGKLTADPNTGQLTTTVSNTPQSPFESLKLELFGGPRASLTTPAACGTYTSSAVFTPWSGGADHVSNTAFNITSGAEGTGCAQLLSPYFLAAPTSAQAGEFTNFELTLAKADSNQTLTGLTVTTPPGLAAMLSSVERCHEPQDIEGTCGPASQIGEATASSGLGPEPFTVTGGRVYLTDGNKNTGAPFGLTTVVPAKAGPFDFGNVVTRSDIFVNPTTAAVTIVSSLPTMVKTLPAPERGKPGAEPGVPSQIKQIHVEINRPNFEFNPTNCAHMETTGIVSGAQGGQANVSSPLQVTGCPQLPFAPKLTAEAGSKASRLNGTSFNVTVESAGLHQANIAKVYLQLPAALPSRLTTIQKACVDAVFQANPAACDEGSVIGHATVNTPVLKSALTGPAYLVSHGGAAFPDVEFVLQGEGITFVLDGKTDIKKGITYSRFESSPDAPFTKFVTELPAGPHSALTIYEPKHELNICGSSLIMPTEITGQNGANIREMTEIKPSGCQAVQSFHKTNAQLLAEALKKCHKLKKHNKRVACEKAARKKYPVKSSKSGKKHTKR
jgi:hypothetical protein